MSHAITAPNRSARRATRLGVEALEDRTTPTGDATIAAGSVSVSTASLYAGAIWSIQYAGHEYVDNTDTGRLAQSVVNAVPASVPGPGNLLLFNPTEGGAFEDDRYYDPSTGTTPLRYPYLPSTSQLLSFSVPQSNQLTSLTRMAFWTHAGRPLDEIPGNPIAYNQQDVSNEYVQKTVTIGAFGMGNVIQHQSTFYVDDANLKQLWLTPLIIFTRGGPNGGYDLPVNWMYDPDSQQVMPAGPNQFGGPAIKWTGSYDPSNNFAIAVVSQETTHSPGTHLTPVYGAGNNGNPSVGAGWGSLGVGFVSDNNMPPQGQSSWSGTFSFNSYVVVGPIDTVVASLRTLQRQGVIRAPAQQFRADFNGDGIADILWHDPATGANSIDYIGLPGGSHNLAVVAHATLPATPAGFVPAVGDFDGDRISDILWYNTVTGVNDAIWYGQIPTAGNNNQFVRQMYVFNMDPTYVAAPADFNGDGVTDLLWVHPADQGGDGIWYLRSPNVNGNPIIQNVSFNGPAGYAAYPGDFNGDHAADILWFRPYDGSLAIEYLGPGAAPTHWLYGGASVGFKPSVGDFNGDGIADILWHNIWGTGQPDGIWYLAANWSTSSIPVVQSATFVLNEGQDVNNPYVGFHNKGMFYVPHVADFNGDGIADIYWESPTGNDPAALDDRIWYMGPPNGNGTIVYWQVFFAHDPYQTPY